MASFNKVILAGNLTRDPELRYTPKGTAVAKIGLAVNRTWKTETGETKEEVSFIDVEPWDRQAEVIAQYMRKGRPLLVEGRLKLDTWEDKTTHQKQSKLKVVLEGFSFIDSKGPEGGARAGEAPPGRCARRRSGRGPPPPNRPNSPEGEAAPPKKTTFHFNPIEPALLCQKHEVILIQNIVGLGGESDLVKVAPGYARNYLFPQGLAVPLTAANKRRIEALKKRRGEREAHEFNTMTELSKSISKLIAVIAGQDRRRRQDVRRRHRRHDRRPVEDPVRHRA